MKKMKIIGLSLGLVGLATIGSTIPFIVSSCSTNEQPEVNQEAGYVEVNVQETAIQFSCLFVLNNGEEDLVSQPYPPKDILNKDTINFFVPLLTPNAPNLNLLLTLNKDVNNVLSNEDIIAFNLDPNAKIEWTLEGWNKHENNPDDSKAIGFVTNKLSANSTQKLIGKVGNIKFKITVNIKVISIPIK